MGGNGDVGDAVSVLWYIINYMIHHSANLISRLKVL